MISLCFISKFCCWHKCFSNESEMHMLSSIESNLNGPHKNIFGSYQVPLTIFRLPILREIA